jgi:hypothetical protein
MAGHLAREMVEFLAPAVELLRNGHALCRYAAATANQNCCPRILRMDLASRSSNRCSR